MPTKRKGSTMALRGAKRRKRSMGNKKKGGRRAANPISKSTTTQRDVVSEYRKRKPNLKAVKSAKKFASKVRAVEAQSRGLQTLIIQGQGINQIGSGDRATKQFVLECQLYSLNGGGVGRNDKDLILNESKNIRKTVKVGSIASGGGTEAIDPDTAVTELARNNVSMKSARIEMTFTNGSSQSMECDFYILKHYFPRGESTNEFVPLVQELTDFQDDYAEGGTFYNSSTLVFEKLPLIDSRLRGVDLFDLPLGYIGAKIQSKTRYIIRPGEHVTIDHHDPKRRLLIPHSNTTNTATFDNDTTSFVMMCKPVTPYPAVDYSIQLSYTKHYRYTVQGEAERTTSYVLQTQPAYPVV